MGSAGGKRVPTDDISLRQGLRPPCIVEYKVAFSIRQHGVSILTKISPQCRHLMKDSHPALWIKLGMVLCALAPHPCSFASSEPTLPSSGIVVAVFDGDTLSLHTGERVRYLGIDAPEVAHPEAPADCYGEEARRFNRELVLHKMVYLRYDQVKTDSHGRLLAYVFTADGRCVNAEMLINGYALIFRSEEGFEKFSEFLAHQRRAIRERRGMWGQCTVKPSNYYLGNRRSHVFHRPDCSYGRTTGVRNRIRFETRNAALEEAFSPCRRCRP